MIESIPLVLTGLGLTASILYYSSILQNANKTRELQLKAQELTIETRQAQLFTQYFFYFIDSENIKEYYEVLGWEWDSYQDYQEKYGFSDIEKHALRVKVTEFCNSIGTLLRNDLINVEIMNPSAGGVIIRMWNQWKDVFEVERTTIYTPNYMEDFEFLYNELIEYREKIGQGQDASL